MALDEKALRRDGLNPAACAPVKMGDGQVWYLPRPVVRLRPKFVDGKMDGTAVVADDPAYAALVEQAESRDTIAAIADVAAYLLRVNYPSLTDDQLGEVLEFVPGDKAPDRWAAGVMNVVYGYGGKEA